MKKSSILLISSYPYSGALSIVKKLKESKQFFLLSFLDISKALSFFGNDRDFSPMYSIFTGMVEKACESPYPLVYLRSYSRENIDSFFEITKRKGVTVFEINLETEYEYAERLRAISAKNKVSKEDLLIEYSDYQKRKNKNALTLQADKMSAQEILDTIARFL